MVGLAMIQMDANTENQIQVLSETEILTTRGQGDGDCEVPFLNPDPQHDKCKNKDCYYVIPLLIASKHVKRTYLTCGRKDPNHDCREISVIHNPGKPDEWREIMKQTCADQYFYLFVCHDDTQFDTDVIEVPLVVAVAGCKKDDGGGGGSTSS